MKWNKYIEFLKLTFFGLLTGSIFFAVYFFYNFTLTQNLSYRSRAETAMADSSQCTTGCWTGASKLCFAIGEKNSGYVCTGANGKAGWPHFEAEEIIGESTKLPIIQNTPIPIPSDGLALLPSLAPNENQQIASYIVNYDQNKDPNLVYYSQLDPRFNQETGENALKIPDKLENPTSYCQLKKVGCGQTTIAMVLASLVDKKINPVSISKEYPYSMATCGGTNMYWHEQVLTKYGLETKELFNGAFPEKETMSPDNKALIDKYLSEGWYVIVRANVYNIGHFILLIKPENDNYITYDVYYGYGRVFPKEFKTNVFGQTLSDKFLPHVAEALAVRKKL